MRRFFIVVAAVVVAIFWAGLAVAGEYHKGGNLLCADCHTMHYSQQHQYDGTTGQGTPPLAGGGPFAYLLRQPEDQLCQACHDGQSSIPDVVGGDTNSTGNGGRQAGALTTGASPYDNWKGHTLGQTVTGAPGWSGSLNTGEPSTLECLSCHHQHGYNSFSPATNPYRNLKGKPGSSSGVVISYVISTLEDNTKDVRINITGYTKGTSITDGYYSFDKVLFNEPSSTASKYADFCAACHSNFHGTANTGSGPTGFIRHPTAGVDIGVVGGGHSNLGRYTGATNKVQVLVTEADRTAGTYTSATPSCMSCHKAHGNQNPFGLIYMAKTGTRTEQGVDTGGIRDLCGQCHVQGN